MSSSDDTIIITESHDLNEGPIFSGTEVKEEGEEASLRILENQGISIIFEEDTDVKTEPRDEFSQKLMDEGGVEIVSSEEEEAF